MALPVLAKGIGVTREALECLAGRVVHVLVEDHVVVALEQVLGEVALVDEAYRTEARVWLAFVAQAAVTPQLATVLRNRYAELHPLLVRLIGESRSGAAHQADHDTAHTLLALADGLTTHVLIGHLTPQAALRLLDAQIRAVTRAG